MGLAVIHPHPAESPHSRWWSRLDEDTRRYLLAHPDRGELPLDVWRACLASALAEGRVERDGWVGDLPAHHLPDPVVRYVESLVAARPGGGPG